MHTQKAGREIFFGASLVASMIGNVRTSSKKHRPEKNARNKTRRKKKERPYHNNSRIENLS
jgi:hypothetical protein